MVWHYSVFIDNLSDEYSASSMNPTSYIKLQFNKQFIIISYVLAIAANDIQK